MNLSFHQWKEPSQEEYESSPTRALSRSGVVMRYSLLVALYSAQIQRYITHCEQDRMNGSLLFTVGNVCDERNIIRLVFNFLSGMNGFAAFIFIKMQSNMRERW